MNRDVIINKTFTRAFLGYDAGEVDSFLDEVIREFDRIKQELDVARLRNKMLLEELERFHESAAEQKREQAESAANAQAEPGQEQTAAPKTATAEPESEPAAAEAETAEPEAESTEAAETEGEAKAEPESNEAAEAESGDAAEAEMDIQRVDSYDDDRFDREVLRQHGAYVVNGKPCSFRITGRDSAIVIWHGEGRVEPIIDDFRFYAEHITKFYNENGELIKKYPAVETFEVEIDSIQPSQFYVSRDKLSAIAAFINSGDDVVIPVLKGESGRYIAMDGHTRLYYANIKGYGKVRAFIAADSEMTRAFAEEAAKRGIHKISDMKEVSQDEYVEKWYAFCDDFVLKYREEHTEG